MAMPLRARIVAAQRSEVSSFGPSAKASLLLMPAQATSDQDGIDLAVRQDTVDLRVRLAEDAHRVTRGLEITLGGLLIGGRLVHILLGSAAGLQKLFDARQRPGLKFEHAGTGEQRGLRGQQIGAVDGEQRLAFLDLIADVEERIDDPARIGRV